MKILIVLTLTLYITSAVFTSSYFNKKLKSNHSQPIVEEIQTSCNNVVLAVPPYNYNGIVKSGYLNVGAKKGSSALAFIFYGKQGAGTADLKKIPTIIWLNGGPGSSSQLGNLMQLGPFWVAQDRFAPYTILRNNYSWVKEWNILFVDQPVGTGLSFADIRVADPFVHSMDDVANDFYEALYQLYNARDGCFNALGISPSSDLYIFGESYAGKYVPAIAAKIIKQRNQGGFLTGLKGIGIGDPFTHPYDILAEVNNFAYNIGLLDFQERAKLEQAMINASFQERQSRWNDLHDSFDLILDSIVQWAGGVNIYDFTSYDDYPTEIIGMYFNDPDVKKLYSLSSEIVYESQAEYVFQALYEDFMKPEVQRVEYCLSQGLPVLVYNGQNDIIVETPGTSRWIENLRFEDRQVFRNTLFKPWKVDGKVAGSMKSAGKLQYRIVNNAGHLVPMDQGKNALQMVKSFVNKKPQAQIDSSIRNE